MEKIYIFKEEIFEIAKIIKLKFPHKKIFIYQVQDRIFIKLPKNIDYFQKEELKTLIKTRFPQFQLNLQYNF